LAVQENEIYAARCYIYDLYVKSIRHAAGEKILYKSR